MSFLNDIFGKPLPTRTGGGIGKSKENRMLGAVGGANTIRTKLQTNADGSTTMLRTRGGSPEFTTVKPAPKITPPPAVLNRTFIFNLLSDPPVSLGVVANRSGVTMVVRKASVLIGQAIYYVSSIKSKAASLWDDVIRLDYGTSPVKRTAVINADDVKNVLPPGDTAYPDCGRYVVPHLLSETGGHVVSIPATAPIRSGLVLGVMSASKTGVLAVATDGTEASFVSSNMFTSEQTHGFVAESNGVFSFLGAQVFTSGVDGTAVYATVPYHAVIRATYAPPYISADALPSRSTMYSESLWGPYDIAIVRVASTPQAPFSDLGPSSFTAGLEVQMSPVKLHQTPNSWAYYQVATPGTVQTASTVTYHGTSGLFTDTGSETKQYTTYDGSGYKLTTASRLDVSGKSEDWNSWSNIENSAPTNSSNYRQAGRNSSNGRRYYFLNSVDVSVTSEAVGVVLDVRLTTDGVDELWWHRENEEVPFTSTFSESLSYGETSGLVLTLLVGNLPQNPIPAPPLGDADAPPYSTDGYSLWGGGGTTTGTYTYANRKTVTTVVSAKSKDYIVSDAGEDVHLYLDSSYDQTIVYDQDLHSGATSSVTTTHALTLKYVLNVRGVKTEWVVVDGKTDFAGGGIIDSFPYVSGEGVNPVYAPYMPTLPKPTPVFSPLFASQGCCPFIAYTTKAEELGGSVPEIYLDIKLLAVQYTPGFAADWDKFAPLKIFVPHQFYYIYQRFICQELLAVDSNARLRKFNSEKWLTELFNPATPTRLQFYNGIKGAVSTKLGASFSGDPLIEISRI